MASFIIEGGHRLTGDITPQGAKNEVLQIICATLLTDEEVTVHNVPDILDVNNLIQLIRDMGVSVSKLGIDSYRFRAAQVDMEYLGSDEFLKKCASLRGSVMLVGPLLARFGKAVISRPGGDKIGRRRLDTHFIGIQRLGASFRYDEERSAYEITAPHLTGTYMLLDEASVTGTANIVMAAVLAKGRTVIYNAACEPYVQQLCHLLNRMGAQIQGIASNLLTIDGVEQLHGTEHTVLPDMIEVGSFIGMAAMTQSELTIKNVSHQHLGIIPESFRRLGIRLEQRGDDIYVPAQDTYEIESFMDGSIMTIADAPWPGLTPDLLSVHAGQGQRAHPPEDVREPSVLRGQTHRHGGANHPLRPAPRRSHRPRPRVQAARRKHDFTGHTRRHRPAHRCPECRRHQPHPQHRADRPGVSGHRKETERHRGENHKNIRLYDTQRRSI